LAAASLVKVSLQAAPCFLWTADFSHDSRTDFNGTLKGKREQRLLAVRAVSLNLGPVWDVNAQAHLVQLCADTFGAVVAGWQVNPARRLPEGIVFDGIKASILTLGTAIGANGMECTSVLHRAEPLWEGWWQIGLLDRAFLMIEALKGFVAQPTLEGCISSVAWFDVFPRKDCCRPFGRTEKCCWLKERELSRAPPLVARHQLARRRILLHSKGLNDYRDCLLGTMRARRRDLSSLLLVDEEGQASWMDLLDIRERPKRFLDFNEG
jgi:hypothetical protein